MKVKFVRFMNVGPTNPNFDKREYSIGEELEVSEAVAKSLINGGFVVSIEEPKATKKKTSKKVIKKTETK